MPFLPILANQDSSSGAIDLAGSINAASLFAGGAYFGGYSHRKKITVDKTYIDSDQTNFELLVKFTDDSEIGANIDSNGYNIRFTSSDGTTLLDYERESFSINGSNQASGVFWVKIPSLSASVNTDIYIYYKSDSPVDGSTSAVWDSTYKTVLHLNQNPTGSSNDITDSTGTNHGTSSGSMANTSPALIGDGLTFDGSNDYIALPDNFDGNAWEAGIDLYLNIWFKTSTYGVLLGQQGTANPFSTPTGWTPALYLDTNGHPRTSLFWHGAVSQTTVATNLADNAWHNIVVTYSGGTENLYVDGALAGQRTGLSQTNYSANYYYYIGAGWWDSWTSVSGTYGILNGLIDEFRFASGTSAIRSADYIKFAYRNVNEADNELSFSSEETASNYATLEVLRSLESLISANTSESSQLSVARGISSLISDSSGGSGATSLEKILDVDILGQSQLSGDLSVPQPPVTGIKSLLGFWMGGVGSPLTNVPVVLSGNLNGRSILGSDVYLERENNSSQDSSSSVNGQVSLEKSLLSQLDGSSSLLNSSLNVARELLTIISSNSSISGASNVDRTLDTDIFAQSVFNGDMSVSRQISSTISASSSESGNTNLGRILDSDLFGQSSLSGTLNVESLSTLDGNLNGQSSFGGGSGTFLSGYTRRKKITIDNANVDSDLTNFPLLVKITNDSDIGADIDSNGYNIRFTSSDGLTLLKYERQSFSVNGSNQATGIFWVKVPTVSGSIDTDIYIYYKSASPSDGQDAANVWDSNFVAVYHLEQDPSGSAPQILDSTANNLDGTANAMESGDLSPGQVGNGLLFDGSNSEYVNFGNVSALNFERTDAFSGSAIVNTSDTTPLAQTIISKLDLTGPSYGGWGLQLFRRSTLDSTSLTLFLINDASGSSNLIEVNAGAAAITANATYHVAFTYDGSSSSGGVKLYINGVLQTNTVVSDTLSATIQTSESVSLGARDPGSPGQSFLGLIDETRISNTVRSASWIKFEHSNIFEADNEITLAAEETSDAGANLDILRGLISNLAGTSTLSGSILSDRSLLSLIQGNSYASGNTVYERILDSDLFGQSSISGDLTITHQGVADLSGSLIGRSTLGADVNKLAENNSSTSVSSGLNGSLSLSRSVLGQIDSASVVGSTVNLLRGHESNFVGQSTVNGQVSIAKGLQTSISGSSVVGGSTDVGKILDVDLFGQSSLSGNLTITHQGFADLSGTINGTSILGADVNKLVGNNSSTSSASRFNGLITVSRSIAGQINSVSVIGSTVNLLKAHSANFAGQSSLNGSLGLVKTVSGSLSSRSTIGAEVSKLAGFQSGDSSNTTLNGLVSIARSLSSVISGNSSASGGTNLSKILDVDLFGISTLAGDLTIERDNQKPLVGSVICQSSLGASTQLARLIQSGDVAASTLNGSLNVNRPLSSIIPTQSTIGSDISKLVNLVSSGTSSRTTADGNLLLLKNFYSQIDTHSSLSAIQEFTTGLSSSISGQTILGNLNINIGRSLGSSVDSNVGLDLGLLVDRPLLAQLLASGELSGVLSVVAIDLSDYEYVNFVLNFAGDRSYILKAKRSLDFTLANASRFNLTLER